MNTASQTLSRPVQVDFVSFPRQDAPSCLLGEMWVDREQAMGSHFGFGTQHELTLGDLPSALYRVAKLPRMRLVPDLTNANPDASRPVLAVCVAPIGLWHELNLGSQENI